MSKKTKSIYDSVKTYIQEKDLIQAGDRLLLSLSAGKDSMALLDIMMHLRVLLNFSFSVFHLNHRMRGPESDEDELFIKDTASRLGIEIFVERYDFKSIPQGFSFEDYARKKRYEFLNELACLRGFNKIVTAHSLTDNAETVLMRIFQGTGINGLKGIDAKRGNIIRPLLFLSSGEIYNHLREKKILWREDSSNLDVSYLRNYVRNEIAPCVALRFPAFQKSIEHLGTVSGEYISLLNDLLMEKHEKLYEFSGNRIIIDFTQFIHDKRILKHIIAISINECFSEFVNKRMLEEIWRKVLTRRTHVQLYNNQALSVKKTILNGKNVCIISRSDSGKDSLQLEWEYCVKIEGANEIKLHLKEPNIALCMVLCDYRFFLENYKRRDIIFLNLDRYHDYLIIRNRRPGDKIRLDYGLKKVKEIMIENKLDNYQKNSIPLIVIGREVCAIMFGLFTESCNRVSKDFFVDNSSKIILAIYPVDN
jgi:tRNA(Ile)-lysidine synthase